MPTLHIDLTYDKPEWRQRNFRYAKRALGERTFSIIETFGPKGFISKKEALESGLISDEKHFLGVDRDPEIILKHYQDGGLYYGDIFSMARLLARSERHPPIGVFNYDMWGMAGSDLFWVDSRSAPLIREAAEASLERLGACVIILNQTAEQPKLKKRMSEVVRAQHERVVQYLGGFANISPPPNYQSVNNFLAGLTQEQLERGSCRNLGPNYEIYRSRRLHMLTLRIHVQRKD